MNLRGGAPALRAERQGSGTCMLHCGGFMESGGIIRGARTAMGSFGGARILVTLLYEIRRRNLRLGLAALCIGGG